MSNLENLKLAMTNDIHRDIVEPLGHKAKERNEEFFEDYGRILNLFTNQFFQDYCIDGKIDWEKLVKLNSEKKVKKQKGTQKVKKEI